MFDQISTINEKLHLNTRLEKRMDQMDKTLRDFYRRLANVSITIEERHITNEEEEDLGLEEELTSRDKFINTPWLNEE
jgi:hypothetical protein